MVDPRQSRRPWQRARIATFRAWGTDCHWCGHPEAHEVDHITRLSDGGSPYDVANLRPSHGSNSPCPVCVSPTTGRARCCNQERNRRPVIERQPLSIDPSCI
uniref:HNH domain-containing protein n=1 Tax=Salinispora arenicola (strain CNS-205) TaxID=391037 RepID=A8LZZ9_SALAI